jgi:hypothetical protein
VVNSHLIIITPLQEHGLNIFKYQKKAPLSGLRILVKHGLKYVQIICSLKITDILIVFSCKVCVAVIYMSPYFQDK